MIFLLTISLIVSSGCLTFFLPWEGPSQLQRGPHCAGYTAAVVAVLAAAAVAADVEADYAAAVDVLSVKDAVVRVPVVALFRVVSTLAAAVVAATTAVVAWREERAAAPPPPFLGVR